MIERAPPNSSRSFVHKRLLGAAGGFLSGGVVGAAGGFIKGGGTKQKRATTSFIKKFSKGSPAVPVRRPISRGLTARPTLGGAVQKQLGRAVKFGGAPALAGPLPTSGCIVPGMKRDPVTGACGFFLGDRPGPDTGSLQIGPGTGVGGAVMGRYGAGLTPGSQIVDRARCLPGMQLGDDGLCYNKGQIKNSERMWPRGRRPLLTGGEMRAISVASRAAGRLTRTAVRLQDMGLIKKPVAKRPRKSSKH